MSSEDIKADEPLIALTLESNEIVTPLKNASQEVSVPLPTEETVKSLYDSETIFDFFIQTLVPFLLAGFGLVGTGAYLDYVTKSNFFINIPEAYTLTTPLLDLKGNLEMNFASRLSTMSHTRAFDKPGAFKKLVIANFGLTQTHTITVSLTISIICSSVDFTLSPRNFMILVSSAVATASLSSIFIDSCLIIIVLCSKYFKFNPDNISTPIAASVGDIATLFIFSFIGWLQVTKCGNDSCIISLALIFFFMFLLPFFVHLAGTHSEIKKDLCLGWIVLIVSALISGGGGYILKKAHSLYYGYALLQPLIVGLVGNRSAVQTSRISSTLHIRPDLDMGEYPNGSFLKTINPYFVFRIGDLHSKVAFVLIITSIPMNFLFTSLALTISGKTFLVNWTFLITYLLASLCLLSMFMYLCYVIVHLMWRIRFDPDYNAIPLLTSLVDLFGSMVLFVVFYLLNKYSPDVLIPHPILISSKTTNTTIT